MLKHPLFVKCVAFLSCGLLKLLFSTYRVKVKGIEHLLGKEKRILMLWHNRIAITPQILYCYTTDKKFTAFVSNSRDGSYLTEIIHCYTRGATIRVPHDGRHEALRQVIKQLKSTEDIVIITPDGPKGPLYEVKGGIALAAKGAGALVVPMTWKASRFWQLGTWDKLMIPKPFSSVEVIFGEPLSLEGALEEERLKLEQTLLTLGRE